MSDSLETKNGETVSINSMIEALERTPDKAEILEALKGLRADKVKDALGDTIKAAQFDLNKVWNDFLRDGEKAPQTHITYGQEFGRFRQWLDREGIHILNVRREDVNRFKEYRLKRSAPNTVRLTLASCSSFYRYLEAEEYIKRSPFANIKYPRKEYKKAVRTDQEKTIPVMNIEEYEAIVGELERRAETPGDRAADVNRRDSARQLYPVVHFMAEYGLRIGDVLTLRMEEGERFSVRVKGGKVRNIEMKPATAAVLKQYGYLKPHPFQGIGKSTIQGAIRKLTAGLVESETIRYRYSCHDFRHYFAVRLYREAKDVYAVKEALGHSTVAVTEVYLAGLGAGE